MESVSFNADKLAQEGRDIVIDAEFVNKQTVDMLKQGDMRKFII